MEKKRVFEIIITLIIAIVCLILAIDLIFKSDSVNEGKCRVSDAILTSTVEIANKSKTNGYWSIDLSQKNKLSILINVASDINIEKITVDNISVNKGNVKLYQNLSENIVDTKDVKDDLDIEYTVDENNQILIELIALNENILKNYKVPETTKEIVYDGRLFDELNMNLKDIQFKLKFNLNITEETGKINTLKVNMKLPNKELLTNGADVRRLDLKDFKFKTN